MLLPHVLIYTYDFPWLTCLYIPSLVYYHLSLNFIPLSFEVWLINIKGNTCINTLNSFPLFLDFSKLIFSNKNLTCCIIKKENTGARFSPEVNKNHKACSEHINKSEVNIDKTLMLLVMADSFTCDHYVG